MAATTHIAVPARIASPLAFWHLLSLDAPTVAALWTWFIARSAGVHLPAASAIAMAVAVWILYAADRLLDSRMLDSGACHFQNDEMAVFAELEARHYFHHRHRCAFLAGIALASVALGALLPLLDAAALHLYLVEGALLVAWFVILHATRNAHRLPKEIAVGIFFSAAVFIPTIARNAALRPALAVAAVLLGVLCALNCLFLYAWEHTEIALARIEVHEAVPQPHPTTRFALQRLPALAIAELASAIAVVLIAHGPVRPVAAACALSSALLLALHRNRAHLSSIHLRAAADLALLTPALTLPFVALFSR